MFGEERKKLVESLTKKGYIKTDIVKNAFLKVPRETFIPRNYKNVSYVDSPQQIGSGQTISAPHMVAIMCEELDLKEGQKVLEIGVGSGYHAAVVSEIVSKKGHVYSIERFKNLTEKAKENLKKTGIENVSIKTGDGSEGLEEYAPYDRIYVTCAAPDVPDPLINQLKDPGKLLIPVGRMFCQLVLVEKSEGKIKKKNLMGCAFVPLVGKYGH